MGNEVLSSTQFLVEEPRFVKIDSKKLEETAKKLSTEEFTIPDWKLPFHYDGDYETTIDCFMLGNSLNFAFTNFETGEKYAVEHDGVVWKGSSGMWAALKRAIEEGKPILDAEYLADISFDEVREIFRGNMEIPLVWDRVAILNEVGTNLFFEYDGKFHNLVEQAGKKLFNKGEGLVERLTLDFPSFEDASDYDGEYVIFDKRAQLAPAMVYGRLRDEGFVLDDIDELTVFADYVLPKALRDMGVLDYHWSLADRVDRRELIDEGSREELEIRASTLHSCKRMIDIVNHYRNGDKINSLHMDYRLWKESRGKGGKPHHLTMTTAY
jgi:hypothetical protein